MNILVIGANGGVGSLLVQQLAKENVAFTAGVRQSDQLNALKSQGMKATLVDVENDSIETLTETFKPFDKVIFSVGSGKIEAAQYFEGKGEIPREDVATVLKEIVTSNHYNNQEFQIISGDQDIKEALTSFQHDID